MAHYSSDKTRSERSLLRKPWQHALFIAALFVGVALLARLLGPGW